MPDSDLRMAILKEMASIRHELATLHDPRRPPLGPNEFLQRYADHLRSRLAQLEAELRNAESAAD